MDSSRLCGGGSSCVGTVLGSVVAVLALYGQF